MTDMQNEINHMQVRLFRQAWKEWGLTMEECAALFDRNDVDRYIADSYEIFHVQGDGANLDDIKGYIINRGDSI